MKTIPFLFSLALCLSCTAQEPNAKAARYLDALTKRPSSGPTFDRMVDAWLETESLESLEKYLTAKAVPEEATGPRLLLGLFHVRAGNDPAALTQFSAATLKTPGNASAWLLRGQTEGRLRETNAALTSLEKARAAAPPGSETSALAAQALGSALIHAGRANDALRVWNELIAQKPEDIALREDVMELLVSEGQYPAALAAVDELVRRTGDPAKRIRYQLRAGDIHALAGNRQQALETYAACLGDSGGDSWLEREILAQIEQTFRRQQDLAGLRAWYEARLKIKPVRPGLLRALARLLAETGEKEASLRVAGELLALTPGDRTARDAFIALLIAADRMPEAMKELSHLLDQYPHDRELRTQLAELKFKSGDKGGCLSLLQGFPAGDEPARLQQAALLGRFGFHGEAVTVLQKAAQDFPASTTVRPLLASALLRAGNRAASLTEWQTLAAGAATAPALLQTVRQMSAAGLPEEALAALGEHAQRTGDDPQVLAETATLALITRQYDSALPFMLRLVRKAKTPVELSASLDPAARIIRLSSQTEKVIGELRVSALPQDQCLLAGLLQSRGDNAGAEAVLTKTDPAFAAVQMVRMHTLRGEWYRAAEAEQAIFASLGGRTAARAQSLTSLWQRAGVLENARLAAQEWQQLSPASASGILAGADLLSRTGKHAEALKLLRAAIPRMEGNVEVRARLAEACRLSGDNAEAMRLYRGLYDAAPDIDTRQQWLQAWAATAVDAGSLTHVVAEFAERHRTSPTAIEPLLALAELYRMTGGYESRRDFLTQAARLKQDDPAIAIEIAALYERENQPEAAIEALRKAMPLDKTGRARSRLARLLLAKGQKDEGLRLLQESDAGKDPARVESTARMLAREDRAADALAYLDFHSAGTGMDYRLRFFRGLLLLQTKDGRNAAGVFTDLLHCQEELPDSRRQPLIALAAATMTAESEGNGMLHALMPKDAGALFLTLSIRATLEKKDDPKSLVTAELPQSLTELHAAAAGAALLTAARETDAKSREALLDELTSSGLKWARIAMEIPQTDPFDDDTDRGLWNRLAEKYPDDLTLLACAAAADGLSWNRDADPVLARKVWKTFRSTHPDFALLVTMAVLAENTEPEAWEKEILAAVLKVEHPSGLMLMAGMRAQHGSPPRGSAERSAMQRAFAKQMAAWYRHTEFRGPMLSGIKRMVFGSAAGGLYTARDAAAFAALLEQEMESHPSNLIYIPQSIAAPFGFQPEQLPGVPTQILEITGGPDQYFGETTDPLTADFLRLTADHVKNPLLRALMCASKRDPEVQKKALATLSETGPPSAATLILQGAWAAEENHPEQAVKAFTDALALPLVSPQYRRRIDSALLALGTAEGPIPPPVLEATKAAALRLRRESLTDRQRLDLAGHMKALGLKKEAESLTDGN